MNELRRTVGILVALALATCLGLSSRQAIAKHNAGTLYLSCDANNDLYQALSRGNANPRRFDTAELAVEAAPHAAAVLILAHDDSRAATPITRDVYDRAKQKRLKLYVEYPSFIPGIATGEPRSARWERVVVASDAVDLGLGRLHILSAHDCRFLPVKDQEPLLTLARVAGFDRAVFGLPAEHYPILFRTEEGAWIATTPLSNFVTGRYAPAADWNTLWSRLLDQLNPAGAPHALAVQLSVQPYYPKDGPLPADAEVLSLDRIASWFKRSRLLLTPEREKEIRVLLEKGQEVVPPPSSDINGDGSLGILEGYASQILPDGNQLQRTPLRADCQAETAAVLALHGAVRSDATSKQIATNLLDYLYFDSEMCQFDRGNPRHPAYGLIAWGAISPAWRVANYGDDNARALLATIAAAACLDSDRWDAPVLRALWANLRTTGKLGFRGDRIDMGPLEQEGWRAFAERDTINYSPSFEAYSWACFLWAYARTGDQEFLDKAKTGIRMTMEVYPEGWRWGDHLDRSRMLLALAWLVRVEDSPQHRQWLMQVAADMLTNQQPCGAIPEQLSGASSGHFLAPSSNEAYGTSETPLLQENGDPVSDQLYVTNFALIGLHEAVAATGDQSLREAENRLIDYIVRIQVHSQALPYLDGAWFRAFDFDRWDYWSSSGDMGWGAWAVEAGWGPAWNGIVLGLRLQETSLWDLTSSSPINKQVELVRQQMERNVGGPWTAPAKAP